jgi:hypothetical protein
VNEYSYIEMQTHKTANCKNKKLYKGSVLYNLTEITTIGWWGGGGAVA